MMHILQHKKKEEKKRKKIRQLIDVVRVKIQGKSASSEVAPLLDIPSSVVTLPCLPVGFKPRVFIFSSMYELDQASGFGFSGLGPAQSISCKFTFGVVDGLKQLSPNPKQPAQKCHWKKKKKKGQWFRNRTRIYTCTSEIVHSRHWSPNWKWVAVPLSAVGI